MRGLYAATVETGSGSVYALYVDPETRSAMPKYYDLDVSLLGIEPRGWRRLRIIGEGSAEKG